MGSPSYIETQILGVAFLSDDVDRLYFPETDRYNRPFFRKLVELASRYKIRLGSY